MKAIMKPILFSTPMVQATLDGRKTMTRMVIKSSPLFDLITIHEVDPDGVWFGTNNMTLFHVKSPCSVGDILYVRETWGKEYYLEIIMPENNSEPLNENAYRYTYKATDEFADLCRWRSSIHMPRAAARIFLLVTDVRAERVQDITDDDAKAEGFVWTASNHGGCTYKDAQKCPDGCNCFNARENFAELWDALNAKRGYGWDKNPWVWVISFARCEKPQEDV